MENMHKWRIEMKIKTGQREDGDQKPTSITVGG
jgi:hypothetical protein